MAALRVALISPKGPLYRHRTGIFRKSLRYSPLTFATLAALIPEDVDVELAIHDEGIEDVPDDLDADLVGMTVITGSATRAYELAAGYRRRGIPVVLGGPHVTLVPDDAAPHADSIVVGYAEDTWPQLLRDARDGRLRPRYDQAADMSLAGRPHARRDLLDPRKYVTTNVFEATRACVHDCEFCVVPAAWGRRPYQRPVEEVVAEIRAVGTRKALFIDLNLIADRAHAKRLFEALVPLRLRWFGLSTTLIARDEELLELAARSGCAGLLLGFESIDDDNLADSRKTFNRPEDYQHVVDALHDRGISIMGCFVFGMDHDTPDVFERTARFAVDAGIDLPRFAILTPFPGTPLHHRLAAEDRILTRDWSKYDGQHVVFQPRNMSVEELERGHESAWRHAYRYRSIARRLARSRTNTALSVAANLGYRYYAHNLHRYYNCDWYIGQPMPVRRAA